MPFLSPVFAQVEHRLGQDLSGLGVLGTQPTRADMNLSLLLTNIIGFLSVIAFLYFAIQVILAGFKMITSSGDHSKVESAQHQLTQGVIGIVIIVSAVFIISFLGKLLGIDNILFIETWIHNLSI